MEYIRAVLARNLLTMRTSLGLNQKDLAELVGVNYSGYTRWEKGINWPDPESIEKLASYYKVPSSRFFYDPEYERPPAWEGKPSPDEIAKYLMDLVKKLNT